MVLLFILLIIVIIALIIFRRNIFGNFQTISSNGDIIRIKNLVLSASPKTEKYLLSLEHYHPRELVNYDEKYKTEIHNFEIYKIKQEHKVLEESYISNTQKLNLELNKLKESYDILSKQMILYDNNISEYKKMLSPVLIQKNLAITKNIYELENLNINNIITLMNKQKELLNNLVKLFPDKNNETTFYINDIDKYIKYMETRFNLNKKFMENLNVPNVLKIEYYINNAIAYYIKKVQDENKNYDTIIQKINDYRVKFYNFIGSVYTKDLEKELNGFISSKSDINFDNLPSFTDNDIYNEFDKIVKNTVDIESKLIEIVKELGFNVQGSEFSIKMTNSFKDDVINLSTLVLKNKIGDLILTIKNTINKKIEASNKEIEKLKIELQVATLKNEELEKKEKFMDLRNDFLNTININALQERQKLFSFFSGDFSPNTIEEYNKLMTDLKEKLLKECEHFKINFDALIKNQKVEPTIDERDEKEQERYNDLIKNITTYKVKLENESFIKIAIKDKELEQIIKKYEKIDYNENIEDYKKRIEEDNKKIIGASEDFKTYLTAASARGSKLEKKILDLINRNTNVQLYKYLEKIYNLRDSNGYYQIPKYILSFVKECFDYDDVDDITIDENDFTFPARSVLKNDIGTGYLFIIKENKNSLNIYTSRILLLQKYFKDIGHKLNIVFISKKIELPDSFANISVACFNPIKCKMEKTKDVFYDILNSRETDEADKFYYAQTSAFLNFKKDPDADRLEEVQEYVSKLPNKYFKKYFWDILYSALAYVQYPGGLIFCEYDYAFYIQNFGKYSQFKEKLTLNYITNKLHVPISAKCLRDDVKEKINIMKNLYKNEYYRDDKSKKIMKRIYEIEKTNLGEIKMRELASIDEEVNKLITDFTSVDSAKELVSNLKIAEEILKENINDILKPLYSEVEPNVFNLNINPETKFDNSDEKYMQLKSLIVSKTPKISMDINKKYSKKSKSKENELFAIEYNNLKNLKDEFYNARTSDDGIKKMILIYNSIKKLINLDSKKLNLNEIIYYLNNL